MAADDLQRRARIMVAQAKRVERESRLLKQMAREIEREVENLEPEEAEGGRVPEQAQ